MPHPGANFAKIDFDSACGMTNATPCTPLSLNSTGLKTKSDIARLCQASTRTVDVWIKQGRIPFVKIGRLVRFDWNDVQAALKGKEGRRDCKSNQRTPTEQHNV